MGNFLELSLIASVVYQAQLWCPDLQDIEYELYTVCFLKELFENTDNQNVVDVIKETHFTSNVGVFNVAI